MRAYFYQEPVQLAQSITGSNFIQRSSLSTAKYLAPPGCQPVVRCVPRLGIQPPLLLPHAISNLIKLRASGRSTRALKDFLLIS